MSARRKGDDVDPIALVRAMRNEVAGYERFARVKARELVGVNEEIKRLRKQTVDEARAVNARLRTALRKIAASTEAPSAAMISTLADLGGDIGDFAVSEAIGDDAPMVMSEVVSIEQIDARAALAELEQEVRKAQKRGLS